MCGSSTRRAKRHGFLARGDDDVTVTRLVDDACIFLNRPDFPGGPGCALHRAALDAGERPMDWKPNVCWQLPLRLDHHTDDNGHITSTLREWKRRDWGPGGAEFHWWCTESPDAFVGTVPVFDYLPRRDHRARRRRAVRADARVAEPSEADAAPPPRRQEMMRMATRSTPPAPGRW